MTAFKWLDNHTENIISISGITVTHFFHYWSCCRGTVYAPADIWPLLDLSQRTEYQVSASKVFTHGSSCVSFTLGHLYDGTLQEGKFSGLHPHLSVWMSVLMLVWWWWWCWLVDIVWCRSFKGVTMLWPPPPHDLSACCSDIYCPVIPDGSWRSDVV